MDSEKRDKTVEIATDKPDVPFVAYERAEAAYERHIMRYWVLCLVLLGLLIVSNAIWIVFISGYDFETHEITADSNSNAYYNDISGEVEGGVNNGSADKGAQDDKAEQLAGEDDESEGAQ